MAGRFSVEAVFKAVDKVTAPITRMQNRVGKAVRTMTRAFERLSRTTDRFVNGLFRAGRAAVKFGVIGLGAIIAGVGLLVREFSKVEDAEAAFTPLLGGVKKAKELVEELNKTAAETPFQFTTLAKAASQLLPVMNRDIGRTIRTIKILGDTAGGNAQKLDSITRGFTKAALKGKVDMESLNIIAEAGVPIFQDLAAVVGVDVNAAFFKMISAGKVTTKQLTQAFEKMTSEGGIFFNGMQIASKTTTGLFSTLKDNISLTAAAIGGVLAPTIKDLIRGATDVARKIRTWVSLNEGLIRSKFLEFVQAAKNALFKFVEEMKKLNKEQALLERLKNIAVGLIKFFSFIARNAKTIGILIVSLTALTLVLKAVSVVMAILNLVMIANPIGLIIVGVAALIAGLIILVTWIDNISAGFDKLPLMIKLILLPIAGLIKAIKFIKDNFGVISSAASAVGGILGFGGDDESEQSNAVGASANIVSPQDAIVQSIREEKKISSAEVTIKDQTNRAEVTGGKLGPGITLQQTGAF